MLIKNFTPTWDYYYVSIQSVEVIQNYLDFFSTISRSQQCSQAIHCQSYEHQEQMNFIVSISNVPIICNIFTCSMLSKLDYVWVHNYNKLNTITCSCSKIVWWAPLINLQSWLWWYFRQRSCFDYILNIQRLLTCI